MAIEVALPYRSDWREMSNVLDYCKGKGADRASLEARFGGGESLRETLNALEQLGLIERGDGGDTRLTNRGDALAYAPDQAQLRERLVEAMLDYPPYRFPLERALASDTTVLDGPWIEHIWQVDMRLGQPRNRVEEARTFFYRLADEAGLGTYRRGVRGQTTRLELAPDFDGRLRPLMERRAGGATPAGRQPVQAAAAVTTTAEQDRVAPNVVEAPPDLANFPATAAIGDRAMPPSAFDGAQVGQSEGSLLPGLPQGISIQIDMTDWDLERIEAFLRLIGYLPSR